MSKELNIKNYLNTDLIDKLIQNTTSINLIFLDFDGVITTLKNRWDIDKSRVDLLVKFLKEHDNTYVIISSSWRYNSLESTLKSLDNKLDTRAKGIEELLPYIIGVTPRLSRSIRGLEIDYILTYFLQKQKDIEYNYVILDDDSDMIYSQRKNFIHTHPYNGLSTLDIEKMGHIFGFNEPKYVDELSVKIVEYQEHKPSVFPTFLPIILDKNTLIPHDILHVVMSEFKGQIQSRPDLKFTLDLTKFVFDKPESETSLLLYLRDTPINLSILR